MIIYEKGGFDGPAKLFRIHGSAVYKVILPAILSTIISFMYDYAAFTGMNKVDVPFVRKILRPEDNEEFIIVSHPYTIGAFIATFRYEILFAVVTLVVASNLSTSSLTSRFPFSLMITFRLNFAYSRYWEGATSVYSMISKWLDCAVLLVGIYNCHFNVWISVPC